MNLSSSNVVSGSTVATTTSLVVKGCGWFLFFLLLGEISSNSSSASSSSSYWCVSASQAGRGGGTSYHGKVDHPRRRSTSRIVWSSSTIDLFGHPILDLRGGQKNNPFQSTKMIRPKTTTTNPSRMGSSTSSSSITRMGIDEDDGDEKEQYVDSDVSTREAIDSFLTRDSRNSFIGK